MTLFFPFCIVFCVSLFFLLLCFSFWLCYFCFFVFFFSFLTLIIVTKKYMINM
jgi:hypothetical protein